MLRNQFITALRHLRKRPGYAVINILGLAVGLACALLIALYVGDERAYDQFHERADRIYRLTGTEYAMISPEAAGRFVSGYPHLIEKTVRLWPLYAPAKVRQGNVVFTETDISFAEASVFEVFTLPLRQGNPATALKQPDTVVLTVEMASKYFGEGDPVGQTLHFWGRDLEVTGVMEPLPQNTHYPLRFLISLPTLQAVFGPTLDGFGVYTYLLLRDSTLAPALTAALSAINATLPVDAARLRTEPLRAIHLHSDLPGDPTPGGNPLHLYLLSAAALLVLLLAGINFVALATAQGEGRAKEVGVRKALGAPRWQLTTQFLLETLLLVFAALFVALLLVELLLPAFRTITGKDMVGHAALRGSLLPALLGMGVIAGLLAGAYPAFYLSRFQPASVLKARLPLPRSGLRQGLVVLQFAISFLLLVGAMGMQRQVRFMLDKDLGFTPGPVVVLDGDRYPLLREALLAQPNVASVAGAPSLPGEPLPEIRLHLPGWPADSTLSIASLSVTPGYIETLGLRHIAGRTFSMERAAGDKNALVLNTSAVQALGFASPDAALGQSVSVVTDAGGSETREVMGVVGDFNYHSLHQRVQPMVLHQSDDLNLTFVRLHARTPEALSQLRSAWQQVNPDAPFAPSYLDQHLARQYQAEQRLSQLVGGFTFLALVLAIVGLFSLAVSVASRRTKEIGVRKVMGASTGSVLWLLTRQFLRLVLIGLGIALPIAGFTLYRWLQHFPYRIALAQHADLFLIAGGGILLIAVLAVSTQALHAALTNPVDALRYE